MSKIPVGFRLPESDYLELLGLSRMRGTNLSQQLTNAVKKYLQNPNAGGASITAQK